MKEEHSHERASGDDVVERMLELEPWKAAAGTGNSSNRHMDSQIINSRPSICIPSV